MTTASRRRGHRAPTRTHDPHSGYADSRFLSLEFGVNPRFKHF